MGKNFRQGVALAERLYKSAGIVEPGKSIWFAGCSRQLLGNKSSDELNCRVKEGTVCPGKYRKNMKYYMDKTGREFTLPPWWGTDFSIQGYGRTALCGYPSDDVKLEKVRKKQCVYINGIYRKFGERTLQSEFRLSGRSLRLKKLEPERMGRYFFGWFDNGWMCSYYWDFP